MTKQQELKTAGGLVSNLRSKMAYFTRRTNKIVPETNIVQDHHRTPPREYSYVQPGVINIEIRRARQYYYNLFATEKPTVELYYIDLYIIYLLIEKFNAKFLEGIPKEVIMRYVTNNDIQSTTFISKLTKRYTLEDKEDIDEDQYVVDKFRDIFLRFFDGHKKKVKLVSLKENFLTKFGYSFDVFETEVTKTKKYSHEEVMFIASLLLENKIYVFESDLQRHGAEFYETLLKFFNTGMGINWKNIRFHFTPIENLRQKQEGGKNKKSLYKLSNRKVNLLYKNKKIVRNVYLKIKNNKEYCKINKKYILLSKLVRI
jgi:hypothetical protein